MSPSVSLYIEKKKKFKDVNLTIKYIMVNFFVVS